jgi:hypothetical protein
VLIFGFIREAHIRAQLAYPAVPQAAYPPVLLGAFSGLRTVDGRSELQDERWTKR